MSNEATIYTPKGFALNDIFTRIKTVLELYQPKMLELMEEEEWPPTKDSRLGKIFGIAAGRCLCKWCNVKFGTVWVNNSLQMCRKCENSIRNVSNTTTNVEGAAGGGDDENNRTMRECPFKGSCKLSTSFCPHADRCFSCDRWSCEQCALVRGDGDDVTGIVDNILKAAENEGGPKLGGIFLDFDRTFASTKSGASPLGIRKDGSKMEHTLDDSLLNLAITYPSLVHVVTRNSHLEDIRNFLGIHGVPGLVTIRSVKKEATTKGLVIKSLLLEQSGVEGVGVVGVFADDDIREHMHKDILTIGGREKRKEEEKEGSLMELKRVLFVRS